MSPARHVFAVDVMQSVGALRVDVGRLPVDFCAAGGGKWLIGHRDRLSLLHARAARSRTAVIVGARSVTETITSPTT